eukprot:g2418.t1
MRNVINTVSCLVKSVVRRRKDRRRCLSDSSRGLVEDFSGKRVLVTGGAKGIGRGIAEAFVRYGSDLVVIGDADVEAGKEFEAAYPYKAKFVHCDASNAEDLSILHEIATPVDVLVNNVGIQPPESCVPCHELSDEWWHRILTINLTSYFRMSKMVIPSMMEARNGGVIINIASIQGLQSQAGVPAYAASKGGVLSFTRQLAMEYAKHNIRAVAVCPGTIGTPLVDELVESSGKTYADLQNDTFLRGGVGDSDDIAELVCFLASARARNITGEYICSDGGMMAAGVWGT